jgi:acetyl-CoA acetyltransferase
MRKTSLVSFGVVNAGGGDETVGDRRDKTADRLQTKRRWVNLWTLSSEPIAVPVLAQREAMSRERTYVIGVGMTKFEKPGSRDWDYPDMGREAGQNALADAGISYTEIDTAFLAYCYGDSTSGQRALYELGLSGIPAVNVNNNCSTGSSALYLARRFVQGGLADCVLAIGFEKMERGSLGAKFNDRTLPMDNHFRDMKRRRGIAKAPIAPQMFANAGREYMERYGVTDETFALIGAKNHRHSVNNPYSQFQDEYSLQDILESPMVYAPLTKLQCCPTSDGGAAAIVASQRFVDAHELREQAVEIVGQALTTDSESTFSGSDISLVGADMTRAAADSVYAESGLGPEDVDVIELHDCFSANELITYDALQLCETGKAGELIHSGATTYGGKWVVNPSGGLISKGHPLGATGLAQCSELTWQLRGTADKRQVDGARVALQHNIGLGGAAVVTMYAKNR